MRVVLDANIYISSLISQKGNPYHIFKRWQGNEFNILISPPIIEEIRRVTGYKRILRKYPGVKEEQRKLIKSLKKNGVMVEPQQKLIVVTADESDNRYIECAVAGNADYIVTGDNHLLDIASYQGIRIITPAIFLVLLDNPI